MRGQANVTESSVGNPSSYSVTGTSGIALPANPLRSYAVLCNNGSNDVFLCRGAAAVVGEGILLKAGGGSYEILATNLFRGAIYAISASTSTLSIEEDI